MSRQPAEPLGPQWAEHLATFLERLRVLRYSPATMASREQCLVRFFRWLNQVEPAPVSELRAVTQQTVRDFQEYLLGRYTTHTTHAHLITLRRFFEHLVATDTLFLNPCDGVLLPKLEDRLPRNILTHEEVKRILDAPDTQTKKGIRDKAILEAFYSTGIRLEEMARLTIHDVDFVKGFVRVNLGKGRKDRVVPLGTKGCDYVREYLQRVRAEWVKEQRDERALWLSWRWPHQALKKQIIAVMVRQYAKAAGITGQASPHIWRHTCATHLVGNGANIAYAQRLLGHRNLSTTQRYTRVSIPEVKATHARAHPRQAVPAPQPPEADAARKMRAAYRYKKP